MSAGTHDLAGRVRRGALWSGAANLVMRLGNIVIMAVVARILTPRDFGVFAVALAVYLVVSSIGEGGVSSYLVRGDVDLDRYAPTVTTIAVCVGGVLAALMVSFAQPLATLLGAPDGAAPMRVLALAVLLVGVFAVPTAQLAREFRQDRQFLATVCGFVPANVLLVVVALDGGGALAFAWSRVVGQLITGIVVLGGVSRVYRPAVDRSTLRVLLRYGLPLVGANLVNYLLLNADYVVVSRQLGPAQLGVYMLAFNVASWSYSLLGSTINGVAVPAFTRVRSDPGRLTEAAMTGTRLVASVAMPMAALTAALSGPLVATVYGRSWAAAAPVLTVLAGYGALSLLCVLFSNLLVSMTSGTRTLLLLQLLWLGTLVPMMLLGVRQAGAVGAAWAHVVAVTVVVLPAYLWALRRATGVPVTALVRAVGGPTLGSAVAAAAAVSVTLLGGPPPVQLVLGLTVGSLAYLLVGGAALREHLWPLLDRGGVAGRAVRVLDVVVGSVNPWYRRGLVRPLSADTPAAPAGVAPAAPVVPASGEVRS